MWIRVAQPPQGQHPYQCDKVSTGCRRRDSNPPPLGYQTATLSTAPRRRKTTNTDHILNFGSNQPATHKRSCITSVLNRVKTHCSTREGRVAEIIRLYRMFQRNRHPSNFIKSGLEMIRKARAQCSRKGQKLSPTWRLFLRWWRTSWSHSAPVLHIDQLHSSSKAYYEPRARWSPGRNQMWSTKLYALVIIAASTTSVNQEQIQQHRWAVLQASCDTSRSTVHDLHTPGCDRTRIKWTSRTHHPGTSQDQSWTRIQRVPVFWQESNQQAHWIGSNLLFVPHHRPSCLNQACTNKPTAWARETHHHVTYAINHRVKVNRALIDILPRSDRINKQAVKNCNQQWLWSIMVTIISQAIHQDTKRHGKRQPFVTKTIQRAPFHQALLVVVVVFE